MEGCNSIGPLLLRKHILMHYIFFNDIHGILSIINKSFPYVPCLQAIFTNSFHYFVKIHCHVYYRVTYFTANKPKESICKIHYMFFNLYLHKLKKNFVKISEVLFLYAIIETTFFLIFQNQQFHFCILVQ